jgi:hypothetical protein
MVEAELKKRGTTLSKVTKEGLLEQAAQKFNLHNVEQVFQAVGTGSIAMTRVMEELAPGTEPEPERPGWMNWFSRPKKRSQSPVLIDGQSDLLVSFANCCSPLPGEEVMGFITRGRGITVHLAHCPQLLASEAERRVPVAWHQGASGAHTGEIRIVTANTPGMLAEVGGICKALSINVTRLEAKEVDEGRAEFTLSVNVGDVNQLAHLMRNLEQIDGVLRVDRVRSLRVWASAFSVAGIAIFKGCDALENVHLGRHITGIPDHHAPLVVHIEAGVHPTHKGGEVEGETGTVAGLLVNELHIGRILRILGAHDTVDHIVVVQLHLHTAQVGVFIFQKDVEEQGGVAGAGLVFHKAIG